MKRRIFAGLTLLICCLLFPTANCEGEADNINRWLSVLGYLESSEATQEETQRALTNFQLANGLEPTGKADDETLRYMMSENGVSEKDYISAASAAFADEQTLDMGAAGNSVLAIQKTLKMLGYFNEECDGVYGEATKDAVRRFQLANGLDVSGIADRACRVRLYDDDAITLEAYLATITAQPGDVLPQVRTIQGWLSRLGLFEGACTGNYGLYTKQAVEAFQKRYGPETNGVVDRDTALRLFERISECADDDSDNDMEAISDRLNELGYAAHPQEDLQTELAILEFKYNNGLPFDEWIDPAFTERLMSDKAAPRTVVRTSPEPDAEACTEIEDTALSLVGHAADFDNGYEFVRYAYMKNGIAVPERESLKLEELDDENESMAGDIIVIQKGGNTVCGIATADHAVVFCASNGYIVMRYMASISADMLLIGHTDSGE